MKMHRSVHTFDTPDAANYVGFTARALSAWRQRRWPEGPRYLQLGRSIRYRKADLDAWMAAHLVDPKQRKARGGAQREAVA